MLTLVNFDLLRQSSRPEVKYEAILQIAYFIALHLLFDPHRRVNATTFVVLFLTNITVPSKNYYDKIT